MEPMVQKYIHIYIGMVSNYVSRGGGKNKGNISHCVSFLNNYHKDYVQCVNRNGTNGPKIYICIEGGRKEE